MKTVSYADFSSRLHSVSLRSRTPLNATLELTYRCNNRCVHCYCNLPASDRRATEEELSTAEIRTVLDGLAGMGSLWLLLTGGEPLLRPDFREVYLHAKKRGFLITLFTNGTLLDREAAGFLAHYPPFVVEISLYGATEETYEKVTETRGSYEKCMEGIKALLGAGVKLKLKTMALTVNRHEIETMDRLARELGTEFRFDPLINKRIDGNTFSEPWKYRISAEDVVRLDMAFPERMEAFGEFCGRFAGPPSKNDRLYRCGAGVNSIHINPYGKASGCSMMTEGYSLREHGLRWVWQEGIRSIVNRVKDFALPCDDCSLANLCGQCPPWSVLESGDEKKEVTYLCEIAKMREREFEFLKAGAKEKVR